jgi:hypothetical protein
VPSAAPGPRRFLAPLSAFQPLDEPASAFLRGRSAHPHPYIVVVRCLPPAAGTVLPHFRLPTLNLAPRRTNKPPRRWRQRCTDRRSLSNGENASYEPQCVLHIEFLSISLVSPFFALSYLPHLMNPRRANSSREGLSREGREKRRRGELLSHRGIVALVNLGRVESSVPL